MRGGEGEGDYKIDSSYNSQLLYKLHSCCGDLEIFRFDSSVQKGLIIHPIGSYICSLIEC